MAQSTQIEIEAKYRITDQKLVNHLQNRKTLGRHYQLGPVKSSEVVDLYIDTNNAQLLRAGYSLRLRQKGTRRLVTLKAIENSVDNQTNTSPALHSRDELESPLADSIVLIEPGKKIKSQDLPSNICAAVHHITGQKAKLSPLFTIKQTRHERLVQKKRLGKINVDPEATVNETAYTTNGVDEGSEGTALLSIDEVAVFEGARLRDDETNSLTTFAELEAELLPGYEKEDLIPITHFLGDLNGLTPEQESKFVRALVTMSQVLPTKQKDFGTPCADMRKIEPTLATSEVLRLVWREQYMQMLLLEAGVRSDDNIEYVHDMRVAIRRMRAAHLLVGHFFDAEVIELLLVDLKRTAKILGKVRDLDVALEKLAKESKQLDQKSQEELRPLIVYWQQERTQRFAELMVWLDGKAYRRLLASLRKFVDSPELGVKICFTQLLQPPETSQVRHVLPAMLLERFLAVRKYEALFDAYGANDALDGVPNEPTLKDDQDKIEVETLHALRIECKYLRYALEFTPSLLREEGEAFVKQLKKLQNLLGDLNDASVAKEMLLALPRKVRTKAVKRYTQKQDKVIHEIEQQAEKSLRTFLARENRASLGLMLGRI